MPARIRVASILRKAILAGEFQSGQKLSLTELGKNLGVSRTPVREALQMLASEGLVELRMNRTAVVKKIDTKFIMDHYEMRILLECEAVVRATNNQMDTSFLDAQQQRILQKINELTQDEYVAYNQVLHTTIWKAANNQKLYNFLMDLWNGPSIGRTTKATDHRLKSIEEHGEIIHFIQARNPEKAKQAMDKHIRRSMHNILESYNFN
ncbi:MAG TPA: GntR family transcriptional regulator [Firmicutes bacterium]|uniref:GntR family transcriptional regulator n=2 Tax=Capillibacterium thermochitinicola TaxID=2699427 RepID=A0A8J6LM70_9FIRM|nr:GntR family transcriptional regulator [Capillibacterium thermochitinicola]MBA2132693.1 GntR family transcriptional regulator [Capillibacterium thermochitinicola]HHW12696.1 GntR family transcriptional regulator [Bacillota bacterium]